MFNILIAEDELLIRMGLESSIPWNELGFHVIASVSDGQKAWDTYQQYHPDVVITDIRMPKMDGIELIKRIRQESSACKIIIITCIEDFDVLSRSMNLSISGCLLKASMTYNELYSLLSQIKKELENVPQQLVEKHNPQAPGTEWFHRYLVEQTLTLNELSTNISGLHIHLSEQGYLLSVSYGLVNKVLTHAIIGILRENISSFGTLLITNSEDKIYIYIQTQQSITLQMISSVMDNFCRYIDDVFSYPLRFAFAPVEKFSKLPDIAAMSNHYLDQPYFFPDRSIYINDTKPNIIPCEILDRLQSNPSCYAFFKGDLSARYFEIIEKIKASYGVSKSAFLAQLSALVVLIADVCFAPGKQEDLQNFSAASYENAPAALSALQALVPSYSPTPLYAAGMLDTLQYIHENYMNPLCLTELADMLNVSSNYYAILFRKVTGFNFIDFLLGVRMYHARRLLRDTKLPVSQISESCGFMSAAYFSKMFRKYCKMTPHQYRASKEHSDTAERTGVSR